MLSGTLTSSRVTFKVKANRTRGNKTDAQTGGRIVMLIALQRPLRYWPISALAEAQLVTGRLKTFMVHGSKNTWIGRRATKADATFPG